MLPTRDSGCKGTTNLLIIKDFADFFIFFHTVIDMGEGALEMVTVECYFIGFVDGERLY